MQPCVSVQLPPENCRVDVSLFVFPLSGVLAELCVVALSCRYWHSVVPPHHLGELPAQRSVVIINYSVGKSRTETWCVSCNKEAAKRPKARRLFSRSGTDGCDSGASICPKTKRFRLSSRSSCRRERGRTSAHAKSMSDTSDSELF